jgi:hypothetical protein
VDHSRQLSCGDLKSEGRRFHPLTSPTLTCWSRPGNPTSILLPSKDHLSDFLINLPSQFGISAIVLGDPLSICFPVTVFNLSSTDWQRWRHLWATPAREIYLSLPIRGLSFSGVLLAPVLIRSNSADKSSPLPGADLEKSGYSSPNNHPQEIQFLTKGRASPAEQVRVYFDVYLAVFHVKITGLNGL